MACTYDVFRVLKKIPQNTKSKMKWKPNVNASRKQPHMGGSEAAKMEEAIRVWTSERRMEGGEEGLGGLYGKGKIYNFCEFGDQIQLKFHEHSHRHRFEILKVTTTGSWVANFFLLLSCLHRLSAVFTYFGLFIYRHAITIWKVTDI